MAHVANTLIRQNINIRRNILHVILHQIKITVIATEFTT